MPQDSRERPAVKLRPRLQRKPLLRVPEAMLDTHAERFPAHFERNTVLAMFALRSLAQRINDYTNEVLAPLGLTAAKFNYLIVLGVSATNEMTLSEISRFIHTSNATVTSMIAALERDGLVRRRAHELDGRSTVVRLTAKGRRVLERAAPVHHGHWEAALAGLSNDERAVLADLLLRAGAGFDRHFGIDT